MNTAGKFGVYGVQERARTMERHRVRVKGAETGDDAIPLRSRAAPERSPVRQTHSGEKSGYRVREAAAQKTGVFSEDFMSAAAEHPPGTLRRKRAAAGDPPRSRRAGPDAAHNSDEIFLSRKDRDAKRLEAYRLAQRRRAMTRLRRGIAVTLLLALFVTLAGALAYRLFCGIREIRVEGVSRYSPQEIVDAAGLAPDAHLYSFSSRVVQSDVTLRCPYVRTLAVERQAPGTVLFTVEEDTAVFYASLYGEYRVLSGTLRVLDAVEEAQAQEEKLIQLRLPPVREAVAGRVIVFADERFSRQIRQIVGEAAASGLRERITTIDLRRPYNLRMVCDHQYLLDFGNAEDVAVKLRIAEAVLAESVFQTSIRAQIDLSTTSSTSVILDDQIQLEE